MLTEPGCSGCELLIQCLSKGPIEFVRAHCYHCRALLYGTEKTGHFVDLNVTKDIDRWGWSCPRISYYMGDLTTVICMQCMSKQRD